MVTHMAQSRRDQQTPQQQQQPRADLVRFEHSSGDWLRTNLALPINRDPILQALAGRINPDVFFRTAMTLYNKSQDIREADPVTFFVALLEAAELGLSVDPKIGHAFPIARWDSKRQCKCVDLQLGYKGQIQLLAATGGLKVNAHEVYENDDIDVDLAEEKILKHRPYFIAHGAKSKAGECLWSYAKAWIKGFNDPILAIADPERVERAMLASGKAGDPNSLGKGWKLGKPAMVRKTAIRVIYPMLPTGDLSELVTNAMYRDEARSEGDAESVFNEEAAMKFRIEGEPPISTRQLDTQAWSGSAPEGGQAPEGNEG
jgi:phage RecT family recombinase